MTTQALKITGMTCGHCAQAVTKALQKVAGVTAVDLDLAQGRARVSGDAPQAALIRAVTDEGYGAQPLDT